MEDNNSKRHVLMNRGTPGGYGRDNQMLTGWFLVIAASLGSLAGYCWH